MIIIMFDWFKKASIGVVAQSQTAKQVPLHCQVQRAIAFGRGLPKQQSEDKAQSERGFDSEVRVLLWGSPATR